MDQQTIIPPTEEDVRDLAQRLVSISELAQRLLGHPLAGDVSDLDSIQEILDAGAVGVNDAPLLESLGVVFGMMLVDSLEGFDWAVVEDEHGRDPALRYRDTKLLLFPLSMIARRIEAGQSVNVTALFQEVVNAATELASKAPLRH